MIRSEKELKSEAYEELIREYENKVKEFEVKIEELKKEKIKVDMLNIIRKSDKKEIKSLQSEIDKAKNEYNSLDKLLNEIKDNENKLLNK